MILPFFSYLKGENSNISPLIHPQDQPAVLNGCVNWYKIGAITKDTGYSLPSSTSQVQANKSIGGLYNFVQDSSTEKMLATVDNSGSTATKLWYRANGAGAWTEIAAAAAAWTTAGHTVEMAGFIGYCFFVGYNGTAFLPVGSLTGTTFSTATNVTSMPQGKFIVQYRDRIYVLNAYASATAYPFRVYYSSVPSSGAITWTPATDFFDVGYDKQITGGASAWDRLVVFTEYSAYLYDQSSVKETWYVGCSNHRTIKKSGQYLIWANGDGVWASTGGQPQNIAGEIIDFIKAGNPRNFFAEVVDEKYTLYLGTVTVNGVTYTNCTKTFNIPTSGWNGREFYNAMSVFAQYNSSGTKRLYMGTSDGYVFDKAKYTDATLVSGDNGHEIGSNFLLPPISLQDISSFKQINNLHAYSDRGGGLTLFGRTLDKNSLITDEFKPIGKIDKFITSFQVNAKPGVFLQIAGSENGLNPYWSFYGLALDVEKYSNILRKTSK